jgi:predicted DNA-binding transcriptional regulator AlpA
MAKTLEDRFLTGAEVATVLSRPIGTLYNWRSRGEGPPSVKIRGRVMYRSSELERWLAQQEHESRRGDAG